MNIGDKVIIGGRTMLRPDVSLVGLEGIVMPAAMGAPSGCTTVLIDWQSQGYAQDDELPPFVNVPTSHLELVTMDAQANIELPRLSPGADRPRPALGLVRDESSASAQTVDDEEATFEQVEVSDGDAAEDANREPPAAEDRPRLRLL